MRIRHHSGKHHNHHAPHQSAHHHKKKKTSAPTPRTSSVTGAKVVNSLNTDPAALAALTQEIAGALLSGGFAVTIIDAIEAVIGDAQANGAGRLVAGTVSTLPGALQLNGSSQPTVAMVFLNGALTATACYVPTHLRATLATGQDVWVMPINGSMADLQIFSIRNVY